MHFQSLTSLLPLALLALPPTTLADLNGDCNVRGTPGACLTTNECARKGGTSTKFFCPGDPANVQCCTKKCGDGGAGQCRPTSSCTGKTLNGLCSGPESVKCCIPEGDDGGDPPPPPSGGGASDLSDKGAAFIGDFEGFRADFYTDAAGVKTIGYGHACQSAGECDDISPPITKAEGRALLKEDAAAFVKCINNGVDVPLNQNQFDALVSFTFNLGCGNFADVAPYLNRKDFSGATTQMKKYVYAGGKKLEGLVRRRNAEVELFNS